jgi:hypothetical protein
VGYEAIGFFEGAFVKQKLYAFAGSEFTLSALPLKAFHSARNIHLGVTALQFLKFSS